MVAQTFGHIAISSADADRDVHLEESDAKPGRPALHRTGARGCAVNANDYGVRKFTIETCQYKSAVNPIAVSDRCSDSSGR